jgi:hypothetical protein
LGGYPKVNQTGVDMKPVLAAVMLIAVACVFLACGDDDEDESEAQTPTQTGINVQPTVPGTDAPATSGETETPAPEPTDPASACAPNPAPGSTDVVQVDTPEPFARISSPVTVSGRIAAFEATYKIRIFDAAGGIAGGVTANSAEGQVLSPFSADVEFAVVAETPGCIWVYEESAMDGSPINIAQIPVILLVG